MAHNAADSDVRMMIATQVAYMDADPGMSVGELINRTISNYGGRSDLSVQQKSQLDVAQYMQEQIQKYGLNDCTRWVIKEVADTNAQTGFYGCLIDTMDGDAILGFRGSESLEDPNQLIKDWGIADVGLLNNTETMQQRQATEFTQYINNKYGNQYDSYSFTGHSLGGNLAEHATITAPDGMSIHRCVNYDGPGYSNEYILIHGGEIMRRKGVIDHYQYSLVGSLLFPLPGTNYQTIAAHNDEESEGIGAYFVRHHTRNIEFDAEGNVQPGERDALSAAVSPLSQVIELTPQGLWWILCPQLAMLWTIVETGPGLLNTLKEKTQRAVESIEKTLKTLKDAITNWFRSMFGVALTGEFEVNVSYINAMAEDLDEAARKLSRISGDISSVASRLRYNSMTGAYYKSRLRNLSNKVASDQKKTSAMAGAVRTCGQYASKSDSQAAQLYRSV